MNNTEMITDEAALIESEANVTVLLDACLAAFAEDSNDRTLSTIVKITKELLRIKKELVKLRKVGA